MRDVAELDDHRALYTKEICVRKVFWTLTLFILCASLLGLLGPTGPLSKKSAALPNGELAISLPRIVHFGTKARVRVFIRTSAQNFTLFIDRRFIQRQAVSKVVPEPSSTILANDAYGYTFGNQGEGTKEIIYEIEPRTSGITRASAWLRGGEKLSFSTVVLP